MCKWLSNWFNVLDLRRGDNRLRIFIGLAFVMKCPDCGKFIWLIHFCKNTTNPEKEARP